MLRMARWLTLWAAALLLGGCGMMIPQTVGLRTDWPAGVPREVELTKVPFFPQDEYQCGPAALAMVMNYDGVNIRPEQLKDEVWLPSRQGTLQLEMLAAPRRHGLVSYRLAPSYSDMLREVAAGHPVIVLQDAGFMFLDWHYAVVNGFDYSTGTIFMRSGLDVRQQMPFSYFERIWLPGRYWAMGVLPPDMVAASATEDKWLVALLGLARGGDKVATVKAYRAALARWPDSLPAAVGLANHLHEQGSLAEATQVLRTALERHPDSVIVMNNLAQTLSDEGHNAEALLLIRRADAAQSPFGSEVKAPRQLIEQRARAPGG